ncbi:hypothetical protein [Telluribacter sp. SYSU D00476]|uniref:hypothetical protein n=1 Tax=Telluribacter sp. SYSU D00476 TaxID=2811430 RepID=UPI001FF2204C|nr:hypothetical protein [Telluribacter sp. SYSU D00476]
MHYSPFVKAGLLALVVLISTLVGWEIYLRSQGFEISYNDDNDLWAYHRQQVYKATAANPVIIGSSRVKFGIDLATWEATSGAPPTQLAMVGTSPRPILADLARDKDFKGTVLIGITEGLFFSPTGSYPEQQANKCTAYYPQWSIAQRTGFYLNRQLESRLLFLDIERFNLRSLLNRAGVANRPGVFALPAFPMKFVTDGFNRQTTITQDFMADTAMQNEQKAIWMYVFTKAPQAPMTDSLLTTIFGAVKSDVATIRKRGGQVLFVRMPTSGKVWELEKQVFPREKYWDRLLAETGVPGIHFQDYRELARYECPEWSHLSPADARTFTRDLIRIAEQKTGWRIARSSVASASTNSSTLAAR